MAVLTTVDLPLAELTAMRLDGVVVAVGPAFAPLDDIPNRWQRASAIAPYLRDRLVAERETAAWIWGAAADAPVPLQLCASVEARVAHRLHDIGVVVREVVFDDGDVVMVQGISVTTPARTAADLLRAEEDWTRRRSELVRDLLGLTATTEAAVRQRLDRHKLSHRRRALERLDALGSWAAAQPEFTRYTS